MASLKIQLKTLKNQKYDLDVTETMTVKDVKGLCDTKLQLGAPDTQRLIHAGKILKDEQTIGECKIKENDIVVIMTSKAKAAAPAPATATAPASAPASGAAAAAPVTPAKPEEATKPAAAPAAATSAAAASPAKPAAAATGAVAKDEGKSAKASADASSQLVMGESYNTMIANLMGLGFTHDKVVKALQAAFNNPDRAVEYLFNPAAMETALRSAGGAGGAGAAGGGGGAGGQGGAQQQAGSSNAGQGGQGAAAQGGAQAAQGGAQAGQAMAAELNQLRAIMQQQPQIIPLLLQQIAQSDPQLAAAVQQNPDAFVRLLQNPQLAGQLLAAAAHSGGGGGGGGGQQGAGLANQPRAVTVQLTAEEKKSIDNLVRLGFSQNKAIEAFILCDRKEDVAANYLFENRNEGADEDY